MMTLRFDNLHAWPKKIKTLSNMALVMLCLLCWYGFKGHTYQQTLTTLQKQQQQLLHQQAQQLRYIKKFKAAKKITPPFKPTPTLPQQLTAQQRLAKLQTLAERAPLHLKSVTLRHRYKHVKNTVWVLELNGSYQPLLNFLHQTINLPSIPLLIDYQLTQTPEGLQFQGFFKHPLSRPTQLSTNASHTP